MQICNPDKFIDNPTVDDYVDLLKTNIFETREIRDIQKKCQEVAEYINNYI
jgi:hypothetical protein